MIDGNRFYEIQGHQYPSVTTILKIISKPGLMIWLAKQQEQSIKDITDKALDIGSQAHAGIAALTQRFLGKPIEIPPVVDDAMIAIRAWDTWVERESIRFLESEVLVWCEECEYAGTLDFIATTTGSVKTGDKTPLCIPPLLHYGGNECSKSIDKSDSFLGVRIGGSRGEEQPDPLIIGDYKTSKALYRDYELQIVAYAHAWLVCHGVPHEEAMTPNRRVSLCLIRLPKSLEKDANGIEVKYLDNPPAMSVFLAARDLWRFMQNV